MLFRGLSLWMLFLASCLSALALPAAEDDGSVKVFKRAKKHSTKQEGPSYAPYYVDCPSDNIVESLSSNEIPSAESEYLSTRSTITNTAMKDFLRNANLPGLNADTLSGSEGPSIGIALSGGGLRAMILGSGALSAMDARHDNHTVLTGLLQASDYLVGTDGSAWTVGGIALNNFSTINDFSKLWAFNHPLMYPKSAIVFNAHFYSSIMNEVAEKANAGFNISLSDYWGRVISRTLGDTTYGFPNVSLSSITSQEWYRNANFPYPIITFATQNYGEDISNVNTTFFEASPNVFGTFDHGINSFIPTEYLGTTLNNGASSNGSCVINYDNFGFMMGASSTYFNKIMRNFNDSSTKNGRIIQQYLKGNFSENGQQIISIPNPFQGVESANSDAANNLGSSSSLNLVDTFLTGEKIPLWPLLQKGRDVDVIVAVDNGDDSEWLWPNGNSLVQTYERVVAAQAAGNTNVKGFPYVPSQQSFVSLHFNDRPVFFGCDGRNTTAGNHTVTRDTPPLVIYLPNVPYNYFTNISTDRTYYTEDMIQQLLTNGLISSTVDNDTYFGQCFACAVVKRTLERNNITASPECQQCYYNYCWSGLYDDSAANDDIVYNPTCRLGEGI
ncbi:phospholipase B homolog Plb1 [Schizosaccharomyces pombe]|uniref:Lysophospholipase 1 n=1 Tax=Schizosaccharomyces pombe (strain 972 / ATCC 24843) TaxID=284812 RepID=PLB1_SCHPO|nr:lysophospholipase 1 [Schizosaccharomyces pombe]P78854.2 RecName: Full=Lysophospholipase 1; AltName: Full=Phospholipase B 1; Flags: Precursor [Schizosaccharomyces pombe 972h-]AAO46159.1 phospholipase B-like protein [Schizosaccharomyces pombe]CAB16354.1 phospholipase B homolog Plb1 [Schizosaccharomyces pombe]|eukprot:NP_593196.1 lysophospholipase 1 [Schizosaccharomyces pombe]